MRVIAGKARGRRLAEFNGGAVRPTADRVREALFSILQSKRGGFAGVAVLDLFAGSGALAIEALSRGAASACLVEQAAQAVGIIRENIDRCRLADRARLIAGDTWQVLQSLSVATFDLVFIDPPYGLGLAERAIGEVAKLNLLRDGGVICAETGADEHLPEVIGQLQRFDRRRYGATAINFYARTQGD